jgi:PPOX class probable F420-dependent enzyme
VSRRELIRMTDDEVHAFLGQHHTAQVATLNADGMPHLVTMWYGLIAGEIVMWTYAKSQKTANLRRSPKIACLVEAGDRYEELRGVSITGAGQLSSDRDYVMRVGEAILLADEATHGLDVAGLEALRQTGAKRVAITVKAAKVVSWDHRKLAGRY